MAMAGGVYGLTIEKFLIKHADILTGGVESETTLKIMLVQDAYTPNFDTHDFRNDVTNEPGNSGTYSSGGSAATTTEVTVASPAATQVKFDCDDVSWTSATITARGEVTYFTTGTSTTDALLVANTFGADVSSSAGTFSVIQPTNGLFYIDYA